MSRSVAVGPMDLKPGDLKAVTVDGRRIAIANVDGRLYAFDDECTHEQCSLVDDGFLEGEVVTCGCHMAQFDVKTGAVITPPAPTPVATYPVGVRDGQVTLEV